MPPPEVHMVPQLLVLSRGTARRCSWITAKRFDERCDILRAVWLPLPRNRAEDLLLVCLGCDTPRRYLYGWEAAGRYTNSAEVSHWMCRSCARLRYSSEGGALVMRGGPLSRLLRYRCPDLSSPRPESWLPYVFMTRSPTAEKTIVYALLGMTMVTGLVDAVSYLSLGRVFTANMTGNMLVLAFSMAHVSGLSIARSSTALLSFLLGALLGGRTMARASAETQIQFAAQAFPRNRNSRE
jgi:Protein of unknown function (DUF1275)